MRKNEFNSEILDIDSSLKTQNIDTIALLFKAKSLVSKTISNSSGFYLPKNDSLTLSQYFSNYQKQTFNSQFGSLKKIIEQSFSKRVSEEFSDLKTIYDFVNSKVDIIIDYLNSFESSGDDALKAFLSLIN